MFSNEKHRLQIFQNTLEPDFCLDICNTALNNTAPLKQKYARTNNSRLINTTSFIAIMKRSRLRNNFLKHGCEVNKRACNAQKNLFPD